MDNKMRYVYAVYKMGSFTKAANELFISQPSLSAMIKRAEEDLGAAIFERSKTGISITEAGLAYIDYIENDMRNEELLKEKIYDIRGEFKGTVKIGGTNYILSSYLPSIIESIQKNYPDVKLELYEGNSSDVRDMIKKEEVDIAIDSFGSDDPSLSLLPLASETFHAVVPVSDPVNSDLSEYRCRVIVNEYGFPDIVCGADMPEDLIRRLLSRKYILLKPENESYDRIMKVYNEHGVRPDISLSLDQLSTCYNYALYGLGCSFVPDITIKNSPLNKLVAIYHIDHPALVRNQFLIRRKNKFVSKACSVFIYAAQECYAFG